MQHDNLYKNCRLTTKDATNSRLSMFRSHKLLFPLAPPENLYLLSMFDTDCIQNMPAVKDAAILVE